MITACMPNLFYLYMLCIVLVLCALMTNCESCANNTVSCQWVRVAYLYLDNHGKIEPVSKKVGTSHTTTIFGQNVGFNCSTSFSLPFSSDLMYFSLNSNFVKRAWVF